MTGKIIFQSLEERGSGNFESARFRIKFFWFHPNGIYSNYAINLEFDKNLSIENFSKFIVDKIVEYTASLGETVSPQDIFMPEYKSSEKIQGVVITQPI